jgi:hypothetical protein
MFSQVAIILLGLFLVVIGLRQGDYLNVGLGLMIAGFAATTLYRLRSGK